ncbi:copia protein [Trifolium medium]|uniref:Copia protein n=1 Tax=Trifolium medium TaxID=97028 RepID=A0A392QC25_9FABA|nr:copia protein [Trifolium medium]
MSIAAFEIMYGNAPFSWCSKKEVVVELSSCEGEYTTASMATCEAQWLSMLMQELSLREYDKVRLLLDSKSAIDFSKHLAARGRSKFLRDQMNNGMLDLQHCKTNVQLADLLTKALKTSSFEDLKMKLGMNSASN